MSCPSLHIGDANVRKVTSGKSLGVNIDEALTWDMGSTYQRRPQKKKNERNRSAKRVRQFVPPLTLQTMKNIFYPTVLLLLQRCLGGLGSKLALQLHKLQNHAARIITFSSYNSTSGPLLQELGWDLLSIRRIKLFAIEMLKVCNNMAPEYLCQKFLKMRSTYDTRSSSSRFQLPLPKSIVAKNVFAIGVLLFGIH